MNFGEYQRRAVRTNQQTKKSRGGEGGLMIPLLGLAGETGTLLSEYKKRLRDGKSHQLFAPYFEEELGDLLWYASTVASTLNLDLDKIAKNNLKKSQERWLGTRANEKNLKYLDSKFPQKERFPRSFKVEFCEVKKKGKTIVVIFKNGKIVGNDLTDNAYEDMGYRYHDIFHLAHVAFLGWSPVMRGLLNLKRKSKPKIDEVEDGARAGITEEAIAVFVYAHAKNHNFYENVNNIDFNTLKTIKSLTGGFEVKNKSVYEWESAILVGYKIFRELRKNQGGVVSLDLSRKRMMYKKMGRARAAHLQKIFKIYNEQKSSQKK